MIKVVKVEPRKTKEGRDINLAWYQEMKPKFVRTAKGGTIRVQPTACVLIPDGVDVPKVGEEEDAQVIKVPCEKFTIDGVDFTEKWGLYVPGSATCTKVE